MAFLIQQQLVQVGSNRDIWITTKLFGDSVQHPGDNGRPGRAQKLEVIWIEFPCLAHIIVDDRVAALAWCSIRGKAIRPIPGIDNPVETSPETFPDIAKEPNVLKEDRVSSRESLISSTSEMSSTSVRVLDSSDPCMLSVPVCIGLICTIDIRSQCNNDQNREDALKVTRETADNIRSTGSRLAPSTDLVCAPEPLLTCA